MGPYKNLHDTAPLEKENTATSKANLKQNMNFHTEIPLNIINLQYFNAKTHILFYIFHRSNCIIFLFTKAKFPN